MKLVERLRQATQEIERDGLQFCLAGGLVASLYRQEPRATADIDLVIFTNEAARGESILRTLGLKTHSLRQAELEGGPMFAIKKKNTPIYLLCGRSPENAETIGVDLLLSNMPWALTALERAQANRVDFGFSPIPCLTVEDLVLSKLYSVGNQASRFMDLDDLRSIFESKNTIDWAYLNDQMKRLSFFLPKDLAPFLPKNAPKEIKRRRPLS